MTHCSKNIDNKLLPLAKRYSEALLEVAKNRNELDEVFSELCNVVDLLEDSDADDSKHALKLDKVSITNQSAVILTKRPSVTAGVLHELKQIAEKKDLLKSVFESKLKNDVLNLLYILAEKNKINLLPSILYCFEAEMDKAKNILKVGVVSAIELDSDSVSRLKEKLEQKLHKSVKFEFEVNPDIIAGLVLKIQDKTIDGSMATKLQGFKKMLGN